MTASIKVTASGLSRTMACPGSAILPHVGSITADTEAGNARHRFFELIPQVGVAQALAALPEEFREMCAAIDLDGLPLDGKSYAQEVAFGYDPLTDTAREVGRSIGRNYPERISPTEIFGTVDVVGLVGEDGVHVPDWKGMDPTTPRAFENWQMRFAALGATRAYARSRAKVELIKVPEEGSPFRDVAEFDGFDLADFAAELADLMRRLQKEATKDAPTLVEGPHCRRCPAFAHCPAKVALARSMVQDPALVPWTLSLEDAGQAVLKLEAYQGVLNHARERLEQMAREAPIPLGNGEFFGPVPLEREVVDATRAAILLAERFDAGVGHGCLKSEPSFTFKLMVAALSNWAKRQNPKPKMKDVEREARELLRAGGATRLKVTHPVQRYRPEEKPAELPPSTPAEPESTEADAA